MTGLLLACFPLVGNATRLPLESVLNLYIAQHAAERIEWQREQQILPEHPRPETLLAPGRYLGKSAFAGYYSYRPVLWSELSAQQQEAVRSSPRIRAWLQWFSNKQQPVSAVALTEEVKAEKAAAVTPPPQAKPTEASVSGDFGRFTYSPRSQEMAQDTPLYLRLKSGEQLPRIEPLKVPETQNANTPE